MDGAFPDTLLDDARKCFAFKGLQDSLLEKGLHAYVRHRLTNYDSLLKELYNQEFSLELYPLLRRRVDAAVKAALVEWRKSQSRTEPTTP